MKQRCLWQTWDGAGRWLRYVVMAPVVLISNFGGNDGYQQRL